MTVPGTPSAPPATPDLSVVAPLFNESENVRPLVEWIVQALDSVQYDEKELKRQMKAQVDEAIKSDRMKPSEAMRLLDEYERGLKEYTYLSF